MATYHVDPSAASDGDGSESSPFNTFSGRTFGSNNQWLLKRGTTLRATITPTSASNLLFAPYGDAAAPLPVIDCENSRAVGFDCNAQSGITIRALRFVNQNSSSNGAVRLSGSTAGTRRIVEDCEFYNCLLSVLVNASVNNIVRRNRIDAGNTLSLGIAYGVRVNSATSSGNLIEKNDISSTAGLTYGTGIEVFAGVSNTIRRNTITARSCDGILLRSGATGNVIESSFIGGYMKDLLAFENASGNTVRNVTLWQTGEIGSTYPCLKFGDDFGAGSPSGLNDCSNMVIVSYGEIPVVIQDGADTNTLDYCRIWRPSQTIVMRNDVFGGSTGNFLTHAQMQSAGYNVNGSDGDPDVSDAYVPRSGSPLIDGGADLGYIRDVRGIQGKAYVGAYAAARMISA